MKISVTKPILAALAVAAVAAVAAPAAAQPYRDYERHEWRGDDDRYDRGWHEGRRDRGHHGINARQARIERRIAIGVRQGRLTRGEVRELRHDLNSIRRLEAAYRSDGRLDRREVAELNRRLDWSDRRLAGRLHNDRYAWR